MVSAHVAELIRRVTEDDMEDKAVNVAPRGDVILVCHGEMDARYDRVLL